MGTQIGCFLPVSKVVKCSLDIADKSVIAIVCSPVLVQYISGVTPTRLFVSIPEIFQMNGSLDEL